MGDQDDWGGDVARATLPPPGITVLRRARTAAGWREIFNVASIERAAQQLSEAAGERPLLGRLKYLRAMGFPSPVPKGRGTKAALGLDEIVQTLFALELIHAGMAPTRAIRVMRTDWPTVKTAIAYGWSRAEGVGDGARPGRSLVLAPSVLGELGSDDRADQPLREVVGVLSADELADLQQRGIAPRRLLVLDTQAFAVALTGLEEAVLGMPRERLASEMRLFCAEAFGATEPSRWNVRATAARASHGA